MAWVLSFISEENFVKHVGATIEKYGEEAAFYKMCMVLPEIIEKVVKQDAAVQIPHDTVLQELKNIADMSGREPENIAMAVAVYMLGFNSYLGFTELIKDGDSDNATNDSYLKRIYAYAKGIGRTR